MLYSMSTPLFHFPNAAFGVYSWHWEGTPRSLLRSCSRVWQAERAQYWGQTSPRRKAVTVRKRLSAPGLQVWLQVVWCKRQPTDLHRPCGDLGGRYRQGRVELIARKQDISNIKQSPQNPVFI